ncbi:TetR family transcriptional regulator [Desulfovibrio sp.]|uniref:TetR family transcriptional regulator n=1 Tax=Desulfovibrio sp. TaxID=885 RepID=UPI0025C0BBAF|nr:TetR family transcriptional regulator [Desulfovibrio sp.]
MSKPRSIDRDRVLDMAEDIVTEGGATALTIGAVAQAAGISKGGVQSCFGTKSGLVHAMAERWAANYDECLEQVTGRPVEQTSDLEKVQAHVRITAAEERLNVRAACHLAMLMESDDLREWIRRWHAARLENLQTNSDEARAARIAYLAAEGAFLLRYFGLLQMDDSQWQSIFEDLDALLGPASGRVAQERK